MNAQSNKTNRQDTLVAATAKVRPESPPAPFILVPQHFGCTVFDRSTSRYLPFDLEATALLKQLTVEPIEVVMANEQNLVRQRQLALFFEHFYRLGFFSIDGRFLGNELEVAIPINHLVGPLAVHLEVVSACNLKSTHCFAGELPRGEQALSLCELDDLFGCLASMGSFRVGLTGGEPLLRRDIFDIVDLASSHGLHPCITTNALLITEEIAKEFGKRTLAWLNVSLEGATRETNDLIRGEGTFDRVIDRLSVLSKHTRFTLAFTIMRTNLHEIRQCADLAYKVGAHTAVFRPLYPVGIARQHLDLMPSYADYNRALNELENLQMDNGFEMCVVDPFSPKTRMEAQPTTYDNHGCGAGNVVCSISVSGDVNPCSFLGPVYNAANIREEPFCDIWHQSEGFQKIRNLPVSGGCEGCESNNFQGGCRARALALNGSINAPDHWISDREKLNQNRTNQLSAASIHYPFSTLEIEGSLTGGIGSKRI